MLYLPLHLTTPRGLSYVLCCCHCREGRYWVGRDRFWQDGCLCSANSASLVGQTNTTVCPYTHTDQVNWTLVCASWALTIFLLAPVATESWHFRSQSRWKPWEPVLGSSAVSTLCECILIYCNLLLKCTDNYWFVCIVNSKFQHLQFKWPKDEQGPGISPVF